MVDVFISYKQEERDAVLVVATALGELKLDVWFDTKLRAGNSFDEEIATALRAAEAVLVCWTPAAIQSDWVRAEATEGLRGERLAACFLQPTNLIPPFNVIHAENLAAWAGQTDDPNWRKLLQRIGELTDRPGLSTYYDIMGTEASLEALKAWANANGNDPLVDTVWARIGLREGEGAEARLGRERAEARTAADVRKKQAEKSRQLIRERGLRDPARERRRFLALGGAMAATIALVVGAAAYFTDEQERDRVLRDDVTTTAKARQFLADNSWHPIARPAREKFERLDGEAWLIARTDGGIKALEAYIADAGNTPKGHYIAKAEEMLAAARRIREVQTMLKRMLIYDGDITGAADKATQNAIALFRYRSLLPVTTEIDEKLEQKLKEALKRWTMPRADELRAKSLDHPTEADFVRFAEKLGVDAAALKAVIEVQTRRGPGFLPDGRIPIIFERQMFSRETKEKYDASHPSISGPWSRESMARNQDQEYERLAEAMELDADAAMKSTTWGTSMITGINHRQYGYETVGEFVRFMSQSEATQLEAGVVGFIQTNKALNDALRRLDWQEVARRYNGPGLAERYARQMAAAYQRLMSEPGATGTSPTPAASDKR